MKIFTGWILFMALLFEFAIVQFAHGTTNIIYAIFFILVTFNIVFILIPGAVMEMRASRKRIRAIEKSYDYKIIASKAESEISRKRTEFVIQLAEKMLTNICH